MIKLRTFLLGSIFTLVYSRICYSAATPTPEKDAVVVAETVLKIWDATVPPIELCRGGILPAVGKSFGISEEKMADLMGKLGPLLGKLGATAPQSHSPFSLSYSPAPMTPVDPYLPSVVQKYSSEDYSESQRRQAIGSAQIDVLNSNNMFGGIGENMGEVLRVFGGLLAERILSSNSTESSLDLNEAGNRRLAATETATKKPGLLDGLEQAILFLGSKTISTFISGIITNDYTGGIFNLKLSLTSPMMNLVEAACRGTDFAHKHDVASDKRACVIVNLLVSVLGCRDSGGEKLTCPAADAVLPTTFMPKTCNGMKMDEKDGFVDINLSDVTGLDLVPEATIDKDGVSLFFLLRSCIVGQYFASVTGFCGHKGPSEDLIPGWKTTAVVRTEMEGDIKLTALQQSAPFYIVARPRVVTDANKCKVLVSIRGTAFPFEWRVNLSTQMKAFLKDGIMAHGGFAALLQSTGSALASVIEDYFSEEECHNQKMRLYITGFSLGAGVTPLLSMYLKEVFGDRVELASVGFAAPNVLNAKGVEELSKINYRGIIFDLDPISGGPCASPKHENMQRCSEKSNALLDTGVGFDHYQESKGRFMMNFMKEAGNEKYLNLSTDFGYLATSFSGLTGQFRVAAPVQVAATHMCGYVCKFSRYCGENEDLWWMCKSCPGVFGNKDINIPLSIG